MIFPQNIIGPKFGEGDLLVFTLEDTELTLLVPRIPSNKHNKDQICPQKKLSYTDAQDWREDDQGNRCKQLVSQRWSFEDARSLDDVALTKLSVSLVRVDPDKLENCSLLGLPTFEKLVVDGLKYSFPEEEPAIENKRRLFAEKINKEHLNWIQVNIRYDQDKAPSPNIFIPITRLFFIMVSLEIESLHYAGRTNPYSNDLLKQFELDLFKDFVSHIKVEYAPETIAIIQTLKSGIPA